MFKNKNLKLSSVYIAILLLFSGFLLGILFTWQNNNTYLLDKSGQILSAKEQEEISKNVDFKMFWKVWNIVKTKYVDSDKIDDKKLYYGALSGIVKALKDPYSLFLDPDESKMFEDDLSGSFQGIGAEIGIRDGILTVIAPLEGSPAEKAGLKTGDKIYKVDGEEAVDWSVDKAVKKIRGPKGKEVVLTVAREGEDDFLDIKIIRDEIRIPSVKIEYKDVKGKQIVYLHLFSFNQDTYKQFIKKIEEIKNRKVDGLILDLRNNPGGYLGVAVDIASEWIKDGTIVSEKNASGEKFDYRSKNHLNLENIPTVVLINSGSASASEILAGALQYYKKAILVGTTSFGKGSVQELENLDDGSTIKITVAKWLTPGGINISEKGIDPDLFVPYTVEDFKKDIDPQLNKALEIFTMSDDVLKSEIEKNKEEHKSAKDKIKDIDKNKENIKKSNIEKK